MKENTVRSKQLEIASSPKTPGAVLIELAKTEETEIKAAIAQNPNTPGAVLIELAKTEETEIKAAIAQNPNTPGAVLIELAKTEETEILALIAIDTNTSASELVELEKTINEKLLNLFKEDPDFDIRNYNHYRLLKLRENRYKEILALVAKNPNSPTDLLVRLSEGYLEEIGENPALELILLEDLNFLEKILDRYCNSSNCYSELYFPVWYLEKAKTHSNPRFRYYLAKSKYTPISFLKELIKDPDPNIRSEVISNENIPINFLLEALLDQNESIRQDAGNKISEFAFNMLYAYIYVVVFLFAFIMIASVSISFAYRINNYCDSPEFKKSLSESRSTSYIQLPISDFDRSDR